MFTLAGHRDRPTPLARQATPLAGKTVSLYKTIMTIQRFHTPETKDGFLSGYKNLTIQRTGALAWPGAQLGIRFEVDRDLSPLFPFINASVAGARYWQSPERIQIDFEGVRCTLYPREVLAASFADHPQARAFCRRLVAFCNDLYDRRHHIRPRYRQSEPPAPLTIYGLLPRTNCGQCGQPSCLAFAAALSKGEGEPGDCPALSAPIEQKAVYPVFDRDGNLASTIELNLPPVSPSPVAQSQPAPQSAATDLTARELEILALLARGASNPRISRKLCISLHTVKTHVSHIYDKLGIHDRAQAAVWAVHHQII